MKFHLINILLIAFSFNAIGQSDCACCSESNQQFDFWIGEWIVYDALGVEVGKNNITKLESGCMLSEEWTGAKGTTGRSYNYFNNADSTWNQLWLDNQGTILNLKGKLESKSIVLRSELKPGKKIDFYYNRITWTPNANGSVTQKWDVLNKENQVPRTLFVGIYKKRD